jgi:hypothetical protein
MVQQMIVSALSALGLLGNRKFYTIYS